MTFLAPGFFLASLAVAAAVVALHFIVTRQPRAGVLPTARFVPDLPATATARATRPSDLLLMLLRVLLVLAAGAGLAKPVIKPSRGQEARVILADVSRAVTDTLGLRDSVRAQLREHDALILFDSSARIIASANADSINSISPSRRQGNLAAALVAAMRAASGLRETADSLELVIVSPFAKNEGNAALESVRALWPGGARLVVSGRQGATPDSAIRNAPSITVRGAVGDPVSISARLAGASSATIIRDGTAAIAADNVVDWPPTVRPRGSVPRARPDTIGGVTTGSALVVAGFNRRWSYPGDSIRDGVVIARWIDGEPAAVEWRGNGNCTSSVAVPVTPNGDFAIRADFIAFVRAITSHCASSREFVAMDPATMTALQGRGGLAPRDAFRPRSDTRSSLEPWLLGLALAAAIAELFLRRSRAVAVAAAAKGDLRMASAA